MRVVKLHGQQEHSAGTSATPKNHKKSDEEGNETSTTAIVTMIERQLPPSRWHRNDTYHHMKDSEASHPSKVMMIKGNDKYRWNGRDGNTTTIRLAAPVWLSPSLLKADVPDLKGSRPIRTECWPQTPCSIGKSISNSVRHTVLGTKGKSEFWNWHDSH